MAGKEIFTFCRSDILHTSAISDFEQNYSVLLKNMFTTEFFEKYIHEFMAPLLLCLFLVKSLERFFDNRQLHSENDSLSSPSSGSLASRYWGACRCPDLSKNSPAVSLDVRRRRNR